MNSRIQLQISSQLNFLAPTVCNDLIRIGKHNDGAYIVPQSTLKGTEALVSCGISDDWSFETNVLAINQRLAIHAYDHTISHTLRFNNIVRSVVHLFLGKSTLRYVGSRVQVWFAYKRFVTGKCRHCQERVYNKKDEDHDVTVHSIIGRLNTNKNVMKIDIEGSEYRIIDEVVK